MALLGNFDENYTRTGKGFLTRIANWVSVVPVLGTFMTPILGGIDTLIESASWLFRGKVGSAATALAGGVVSTTVNSLNSLNSLTWWNVGSGLATSTTLGTHARKMTEGAIGAVTGALGAKPTVLRSYPAGIGSIGMGFAPQGPGQFAAAEAQRRGQDPRAYYNTKMNGDMAQHVAELDSARAQPNYQGIG